MLPNCTIHLALHTNFLLVYYSAIVCLLFVDILWHVFKIFGTNMMTSIGYL